jgi:hypothetical protein
MVQTLFTHCPPAAAQVGSQPCGAPAGGCDASKPPPPPGPVPMDVPEPEPGGGRRECASPATDASGPPPPGGKPLPPLPPQAAAIEPAMTSSPASTQVAFIRTSARVRIAHRVRARTSIRRHWFSTPSSFKESK